MINFNKQIQQSFANLEATGKLFRSEISGETLWEIYLNSFKDGQDPTFRDPASTSHTCNHCNNFIRRYGNVVALDASFNIITMFDFVGEDNFEGVAEKMSEALKKASIKDVFFETFEELNSLPYEQCSKTNAVFRLGIDKNVKRYTKEEADLYTTLEGDYIVKPNETRIFNHMFLNLQAAFVHTGNKSIGNILNDYRSAYTSFEKAMREIPADTLSLVIDLIAQDSLINGKAYLKKVESFLEFKKKYDAVAEVNRDAWCWVTSYNLPIATFRAELIGQLCIELAEGMDLNKACKNWNFREDPSNKMKPTAPITAKQKEEAEKFVVENGYSDSFDRRFATIDDIKVSEIKHINVGDGKLKSASIFDGVKTTSTRHKRAEFEGIAEVTIDAFMKDILPGCSSVEAYFTNEHEDNLVSLTTSINQDCKPIFKWSNPYSWTFNGNLAGKSEIKKAVKDAGGNVEGVLNFRLAWNGENTNGKDGSDLDAWASEPSGGTIGFDTLFRKDRGSQAKRSPMSGQLDVDNRHPGGVLAVENIVWTNKAQMKPGEYKVWVNQFTQNNSQGFVAEIEFEGETFVYTYASPLKTCQNVQVATITLSKEGKFSINHHLPVSGSVTKEVYGIETGAFHKVNLVCNSPNFWGDNAVGNKFYMFMIEGCKAPGSIRSFHNENLIPDLLTNHKHVMNTLGNVHHAPASDKQLSGLGFNATVRDELIVRLGGAFKRVVKIKF